MHILVFGGIGEKLHLQTEVIPGLIMFAGIDRLAQNPVNTKIPLGNLQLGAQQYCQIIVQADGKTEAIYQILHKRKKALPKKR